MVATADVSAVLESARQAQTAWASTDLISRLRIIRRLRDRIARDAKLLLDLFPARLERAASESLTSEVIPLAEACKFLEREAERLLAPCRLSTRSRPFWLRGTTIETRREPHGIVLIIGPANYPLFLPGVQAIQALVTGNAVIVKPGRGGSRLMTELSNMASDSGLPLGLFAVLDESVDAAQEAIALGVDKIVVTGSIDTGRAVLKSAAHPITPVTAELSGIDPVIVLASADLEKAVRAIRFGRALNHGETCIAPHRMLAHESIANQLQARLNIPITPFRTVGEAVREANASDYALGATVFGEEGDARQVANLLCAGVVVVNDMIVPTADPRLSFGGRKWSGFGKTRGAEGLLEMTVTKAVVIQRARRLRHLEPLPVNSTEFFLSVLAATHRMGFSNCWKGWIDVCKFAVRMRKHQ